MANITGEKGLKLIPFGFIINSGGEGSDYLVLVHFKV
jgi:hypothetical protein